MFTLLLNLVPWRFWCPVPAGEVALLIILAVLADTLTFTILAAKITIHFEGRRTRKVGPVAAPVQAPPSWLEAYCIEMNEKAEQAHLVKIGT